MAHRWWPPKSYASSPMRAEGNPANNEKHRDEHKSCARSGEEDDQKMEKNLATLNNHD
jgi:hypothetical protein